jgi:hypothetical protein
MVRPPPVQEQSAHFGRAVFPFFDVRSVAKVAYGLEGFREKLPSTLVFYSIRVNPRFDTKGKESGCQMPSPPKKSKVQARSEPCTSPVPGKATVVSAVKNFIMLNIVGPAGP